MSSKAPYVNDGVPASVDGLCPIDGALSGHLFDDGCVEALVDESVLVLSLNHHRPRLSQLVHVEVRVDCVLFLDGLNLKSIIS